MEGTISIITASYNSEKTISSMFNSLINQTCIDFEFILIDGDSKDNTLEIIKEYEPIFLKNNISFTWRSDKDNGIYDAWNKGLKLTRGNWISFLGSDDVLMPNAIELYKQKTEEKSLGDIDIIHSKVEVIKNDKVIKLIDGLWSWKTFKNHMNIAHVGALHNINYFKKYDVFDESYKITGDYELLLRAGQNLKCLYINAVTARMAYGGVSTSNVKKVFLETLRAKNQTGNVNIIRCWLDFYIASFKYRIKKIISE